jgi:hypothetical protein
LYEKLWPFQFLIVVSMDNPSVDIVMQGLVIKYVYIVYDSITKEVWNIPVQPWCGTKYLSSVSSAENIFDDH